MDAPTATPYEPALIRLPFPADYEDEPFDSIQARAHALCEAAKQIFALASSTGQDIAISEDTRLTTRDVFSGITPAATLQTTAEFLHLSALLNAYDITVVQSAQQIRNFCTNILLDKAATAAKDSDRLRAVEMLGKIADVALFEERSTVLVAQMSTEDIKKTLRDKVGTLRSKMQGVIDVEATPLHHAAKA